MENFIVRINLEPDNYSGKIIDKRYPVKAETAENLARDEYPDAEITWAKPESEMGYVGPFFNSIRTIRGDIDELKDEELVQWLANATKTEYNCLGHKKAARNKYKAKSYKEKLKERDVEIPDLDELLADGIFNGPGSS